MVLPPGAISFALALVGESCAPVLARRVGDPEDEQYKSITFAVFCGKRLYENRVNSTPSGTLFTSAYRVFAYSGACDYVLSFSNFNRQKGSEITYRVYNVGIAPDWGDIHYSTTLNPWFNELDQLLISGKISQEEYREAESEWLRQLMD